jgi:hypothetical protein
VKSERRPEHFFLGLSPNLEAGEKCGEGWRGQTWQGRSDRGDAKAARSGVERGY